MTLSSALNTAQSIFSNTATQMAVTSKNISNANNADYSRRDAQTVTTGNGATLAQTTRASDLTLMRHDLDATAALSGQSTLYDGLQQLQSILGGNDYATSPSTYISNLQNSLQSFAAAPSNTTLAQSVVTDATDVANALNKASTSVQDLRTQADQQIGVQVTKLRDLLDQFKVANDAVKGGTAAGREVNDDLDKRDALLKQISGIVGVQTVTRDNNDMVLYTSDGTTLFETSPREISFNPQPGYDANTTGNKLYIDGVELGSGEGGNTSAQGSLQAYLQLRDKIAPTFQSQLDEIGRGLVTLFSEKDQTGSSLPDLPGLFTWSGGTVPASGTVEPGLSATISVNPAVIASQGGNAALLRDGGINGASYVSNTSGAEGFSTTLQGYVTSLGDKMPFDSSTQLNASLSITDYASASIGWLEEFRSQASNSKDAKAATSSRSTEALSNSVGVSLDEELSKLLDLEQSYKASAKIVSTVDAMMQALLAAAG
jgi:flagellar hook-associated protein 1